MRKSQESGRIFLAPSGFRAPRGQGWGSTGERYGDGLGWRDIPMHLEIQFRLLLLAPCASQPAPQHALGGRGWPLP